jgi:uncharacterized coiled-coil DUF342 family protein
MEDELALDANGDVRMPIVKLLTGRGFLTGKSGSGKSNSASVIAEELLDRGFPIMIVDTDGEYWGLQDTYEILHVGADEECDLIVGPEHADKLASLALDDGVPIILDVSGYLDEEEANALVRETALALFAKEKKRKQPFLMIVEEVHEYIPESGHVDDTGQALIKIGKRGRKHGLGLAGISQRPADVKKDFITQANWLLWHRLTWDNDTSVVRRVADTETANAIDSLDNGEAFLMTDFLENDIQRLQVRRKQTFDAGATPDLEDFERPELKSVSGDLIEELEEISDREDRRQDRIQELESKIDTLQEEKATLEEDLQSAKDVRDLAERMAEGFQAADGNDGVASEQVEEVIEERNELQSELDQRDERIGELKSRVAELEDELSQRPDISERSIEAVGVLADEFDVHEKDTGTLQRKLRNARERIDELETELEQTRDVSAETHELSEMLQHEAVQDAVDVAKDTDAADKHFDRVLAILASAEGGPVSAADIAPLVEDVETQSPINKVLRSLYDCGVLQREKDGKTHQYELNDEFLERRIEVAQQQLG